MIGGGRGPHMRGSSGKLKAFYHCIILVCCLLLFSMLGCAITTSPLLYDRINLLYGMGI